MKNEKKDEYKDQYKDGSEGSHICTSNIRRYPEQQGRAMSTSFETSQEVYSPAETDHEFNSAPQAGRKEPTETEKIRRENNRNRDHRRRWAVVTGPIAVDTDSDAAKTPKAIR
jgi:hypothetical protein